MAKKLKPATIARIKELRTQGLTNKATAEQMELEGDPVSVTVVHKYSKELDIPRKAGPRRKYASDAERYEAQKQRARIKRRANREEINRKARKRIADETPEEAADRKLYARVYYQANVEKYRAYYQANRETIRAKQRARNQAKRHEAQKADNGTP